MIRHQFAFLFCLSAFVGSAVAQQAQAHSHHRMEHVTRPVFIASTAKPFAELMDGAMAVMEDGMRRAATNGVPEHDFVTMMIPHHQGAIDMAKALLLRTRDPELRNLAQGIITEQQNEIQVMRAWLRRNAPPTPTQPERR